MTMPVICGATAHYAGTATISNHLMLAIRGATMAGFFYFDHVNRWAEQLAQRKGVQRGRIVNRTQGEPSAQLHERHDASDFDTRTQDKIGGQNAAG